jgi:phospholipase/carboxylesterase
MTGDNDAVLDAITHLLPRLLATMDTLSTIARHMHPPHLIALVGRLGDHDAHLQEALGAFRTVTWPDSLAPFRDQLDATAGHVMRACDGLRMALALDNPMLGAYRAMRHASRAIEALYPVASVLPTVSQYFLEPAARGDAALLERLRRPGPDTGVMHSANETGMRGGFSVYVPEYHDASKSSPLIVALHGGAGHGRLFLWTWLREARTRGAILIAPTAIGDTWSLMEPDIDATNIARIVEEVGRRWPVDPSRRLLTGMSDGGTFTLLSGLHEDAPFTHLAPVAASFHPLLLTMAEPQRVRGLPIMLTHGALDWMFPVSVGRTASQALTAAGAAVVYREIADLSHAYPRDENSGIMDWFLGV